MFFDSPTTGRDPNRRGLCRTLGVAPDWGLLDTGLVGAVTPGAFLDSSCAIASEASRLWCRDSTSSGGLARASEMTSEELWERLFEAESWAGAVGLVMSSEAFLFLPTANEIFGRPIFVTYGDR